MAIGRKRMCQINTEYTHVPGVMNLARRWHAQILLKSLLKAGSKLSIGGADTLTMQLNRSGEPYRKASTPAVKAFTQTGLSNCLITT